MRAKLLLTALIGLTYGVSAEAAEIRASRVEAVANNVKCFHSRRGWFADTTGPCQSFIRPDSIAMGRTFQANGETIEIGFIAIETDGASGTAPSCVAAASRSQIPIEDIRADRTWLFIEKCIPVN
jgi:hypothetical protein